MSTMTMDDLTRILTACAGDDGAELAGPDFATTTFDDLGYDSLNLLEAAARIKREFGVEVEDDSLADVDTPQDLLDRVNSVATV
jgi:minimal PKS acyl carrier protein